MSLVLIVNVVVILIVVVLFWLASYYALSTSSPLIFLHIPKNGGMTIQEIGRRLGYRWNYHEYPSLKYGFSFHSPPKDHILSYGKKIFAVARDPYERALSTYKFENGGNNLSVAHMNSYILDTLTNKPVNYNDCHWIPQYEYLKYADHILRFESLREDFNSLMNEYNIPTSMNIHLNASKSDVELNVENLSPEVVAKLNDYYRKDFEMLSYPMKISTRPLHR